MESCSVAETDKRTNIGTKGLRDLKIVIKSDR